MWRDAVAQCADSKRAQHYHGLLAAVAGEATIRTLSAESARVLATLFSGAPTLSEVLLAHPDWLATVLAPERLSAPRHEESLRREVNAFLKPALARRDFAVAHAQLRQFQQREHLRIAARDLARLGLGPDLARELANVADLCLSAVLQLCLVQLTDRLGSPWHRDAAERWQPTPFAVLGLGPLGGQELDYVTAVALLFVYAEEGEVFAVPPEPTEAGGTGMANHAFFQQLVEQFLAEVARLHPEGAHYRVDVCQRPEGEAGPLACSLAGYENFYSLWGGAKERLMLIQARGVAGDAALAGEFLAMVQPFRYPGSLTDGGLAEIAAVKRRLDTESAPGGERDRHVRLGRGGLGEIEFIAQTLQLLHAGKTPFLQSAQTLSTVERLARYHLLTADEALGLTEAYSFLRDVAHRLQLENPLQPHLLPTERRARERLAVLLGFTGLRDFETARQQHGDRVRRVYEKFLQVEEAVAAAPLPRDLVGCEGQWLELLAAKSFRAPASAVQALHEFVHGADHAHGAPRASELAWQLVPKLLALCPSSVGAPVSEPLRAGLETGAPKPATRAKAARLPAPVLADPARVLAQLNRFVTAYGARTSLYEAWACTPKAFELLLWLFDRSEFLGEVAIRTPDLVEDWEQGNRLHHAKTAVELLTSLRHGLHEADPHAWLRRFCHAEFMRLGLRDLHGLASLEELLSEFSALAEASLRYALEVTLRRHQCLTAPFAILGLGPLGGEELTYGSVLDVLFIADDRAGNLAPLQPIAEEVVALLAASTPLGRGFAIAAYRWPSGDSRPLITTLGASEDYFRQRASLEEIQALSRARWVAGNAEVGREFVQLCGELCDFRPDGQRTARPAQGLGSSDTVRIVGKLALDTGLKAVPRSRPTCSTPTWLAELATRREPVRIPSDQEPLAFRTGAGGLADLELLAQTACLAHGWHEPNTLRALARARQSGTLLTPDADALLTSYRQLRRLESILGRWSGAAELSLPADPQAQARVATHCGFASPAAFFKALAGWRAEVRRVFTALVSARPLPPVKG
ncbi:MAG: hypothetical protein RL514_2763 [Verrucomicrobiota bacterium]